jgi:DNA-binding NarL/FixJ family response regulator
MKGQSRRSNPLGTIIRILLVEDFEPFRSFVSSLLRENPEFHVVCEVSDGLEAVRRAQEINADLILMDIGLPGMNGIEAARQIHEFLPNSKILFVTQETSSEIVQEAFRLGGVAYVQKSRAGSDLIPAVTAVLRGDRFVSNGLAGFSPTESDTQISTPVPLE